MATRQELEQQGRGEQDIAKRTAAEVQDYVEAMEKKAEGAAQQGVTPAPAADDIQIKPVQDDFGKVVMDSAKAKKPSITLPLTEEEVRSGLHHKLLDAMRWAATFCVYMIKKYPGRVFYKTTKQ